MLGKSMFPYRHQPFGEQSPSGDRPVLPKFPLKPDKPQRSVLESLGDRLESYPEIYALQSAIRTMLTWGQTRGLPTNVGIPSGFSYDGKYGPKTHEGLRRMVKVGVLIGVDRCGAGFHLSDMDTLGPNAVRACILGPWGNGYVGGASVITPANLISGSIVDKAQQAWTEWRAALRAPDPPPEATEPVTETPEPTADEIADVQENGGPVPLPKKEDEGLSTATWIALFAAGALVAGGIYYVATDNKK